MSRNPLLEANDFEPIKSILIDLYGENFNDAVVTPVEDGGFSHGYIIETQEEKLFLKLTSPAGETSHDDYAATPLSFMEFLSSNGLSVPTPVKTQNGDLIAPINTSNLSEETSSSIEKHRASMMSLAQGETLPNQVLSADKDETYFDFSQQVGESVGKFHRLQKSGEFEGNVPNNQGDFNETKSNILDTFGFNNRSDIGQLLTELTQEDSSASLQVQSIANRLRSHSELTSSENNRSTMKSMAEAIDNGLVHDLIERMNDMEGQQEAVNNLPRGVAHGDLTTGNFMQKNGEITAIIDFDEIFEGPLLWDTAELMVNSFAITNTTSLSSEFQSDTAKEILQAYESERPLSDNEINLLPELVAERELTYFVRRLEALSEVLTNDNLSQEQIDTPLPRFDAVMMPYRQLEQINQVEIMIDEYKAEQKPLSTALTKLTEDDELPSTHGQKEWEDIIDLLGKEDIAIVDAIQGNTQTRTPAPIIRVDKPDRSR